MTTNKISLIIANQPAKSRFKALSVVFDIGNEKGKSLKFKDEIDAMTQLGSKDMI
jgi:hypothetical protein